MRQIYKFPKFMWDTNLTNEQKETKLEYLVNRLLLQRATYSKFIVKNPIRIMFSTAWSLYSLVPPQDLIEKYCIDLLEEYCEDEMYTTDVSKLFLISNLTKEKPALTFYQLE
jgi:hypothetical protein